MLQMVLGGDWGYRDVRHKFVSALFLNFFLFDMFFVMFVSAFTAPFIGLLRNGGGGVQVWFFSY